MALIPWLGAAYAGIRTVADLAHSFAKRADEFRHWKGDPLLRNPNRRLCQLLRARRERPRNCRAAEQRHELASS